MNNRFGGKPMSSAFRNFILTLVLMLVVLGFAAWKLIPKLEDAVLKPIFNETSDGTETSDSEVSANISDNSAGETEVSDPAVPVEDTVFDCLFITKNDANDVCSAVYVYASKQSGSYVLCSFPVDMNLDNSGRNVPLYDLLGAQTTDYDIKKLSALVGHDVRYYAVVKTSTVVGLASLKNDLTVTLPYDVKFLNPDFSVIPESQRSDEHYITVNAGKVTLTETNAAGIFNSQQSEDAKDYRFQRSMGTALIKQICSDTKFTTDLVAQKKLFDLFDTNMPYSEFSELSRLIFSYATAKQTTIDYPMVQDYSDNNVSIPDWAKGISLIDQAIA